MSPGQGLQQAAGYAVLLAAWLENGARGMGVMEVEYAFLNVLFPLPVF